MAESILMPKSGISVESCIIGTWRKKVGDEVKVGDVLFDYETDKAAFECESTAEGVILEIFYNNGDEVEVLKPVCVIGMRGENPSAYLGSAPVQLKIETSDTEKLTDLAKITSAQNVVTNTGTSAIESLKFAISPRAKNLAAKLGVDAHESSPTGPYGRVIARDVDRLYQEKRLIPDTQEEPMTYAPASAPTPVPLSSQEDYTEETLPKIRRVIAANMMVSLQDSAQLTHHHSFDATAILGMRKVYKQEGAERGLDGISVGDMILFAVSRLLVRFPYMNALLMEKDVLRMYHTVNLGVAIDTPRGLMVPTIFGADKKSLKQISAEVKELAAMARSGKINPDQLTGGTFTVSNLGPTGVEIFTPILNPPQVGILGVCGIVDRVRTGAGGMEVYPSIGLSLTYDHCAVDGAPASRFAQALAKSLESFPLLLAEG